MPAPKRGLTTRDPNGKQQGAESPMEGKRETGVEPVRANQRKLLDWANVDWSRVEHQVEKMQQEIFRDSQANNFRTMREKQKLLARSLGPSSPMEETWRHVGWLHGARAECGESRVFGSAE